MMIIEYPAYYTRFRCIADKCPDTCCAGWEVDLDEEAWYRYLVVRGAFGDKLRRYMKENGEWKYFDLRADGCCPFLLPDHLCEIYEKLGEGALCVTCREHPRYFVDCGDYEQRDLSLGCPEVARLFFTEEGRITYLQENSQEEDREADEDEDIDPERRAWILADRDRVLRILQGEDMDTGGQEERDSRREAPEIPADGENNRQAGALLRDRMQKAGVWLPEKDGKLLERISRMEPLNEEWENKLSRIRTMLAAASDTKGEERSRVPQSWLIRLACYLVFRYWIDAYFCTGDVTAEPNTQALHTQESCGQDTYVQETYTRQMQPQIRLLNRSLRLVELLYAAQKTSPEGNTRTSLQCMIDVAYLFSREVEFDEENLRLIREA